jgi:hypothetical protein
VQTCCESIAGRLGLAPGVCQGLTPLRMRGNPAGATWAPACLRAPGWARNLSAEWACWQSLLRVALAAARRRFSCGDVLAARELGEYN